VFSFAKSLGENLKEPKGIYRPIETACKTVFSKESSRNNIKPGIRGKRNQIPKQATERNKKIFRIL